MIKGEELAKTCIQLIKNENVLNKVIKEFYNLNKEEQCRFLSFLFGYIAKLKEGT